MDDVGGTVERRPSRRVDWWRQSLSAGWTVAHQFAKQCALADEDGELLWREPRVWAYAR
jgi:hypothetical protein